MSEMPKAPKIYHIVHVDRLASIIKSGFLYSDKVVQGNKLVGTNIGMTKIKERRMNKALLSHPSLTVGACIPFYFCPRSIMLYLIACANHQDLTYTGGQGLIVHLEASLYEAIDWAESQKLRWAFTLGNAAATYVEDRASKQSLAEIDWQSVNATKWAGLGVDNTVKEKKQAEFLVENQFPWELFSASRNHAERDSC